MDNTKRIGYITSPEGLATARAHKRGTGSSRPGLIIALISLVLNLLWVAMIPPFDGSDEPAHLMALMHLHKYHQLPEIHYRFDANPRGVPSPTIGDTDVLDYAGERSWAYPVPYESMQPPLYYLTVAAVMLPFPADPQLLLYVARIITAFFGAATVYFIWAAVRQLVPGHPRLALLCALSVAALPQFGWNSGMATNDAVLHATSAAALYVWFRGLRDPSYDPRLIKAGGLFGLMVLAKLTALAFAPALALVVLLRAKNALSELAWRRVLLLGTSTAASTLAVCGWWLLRNIFVYGEPTGSYGAMRSYAINAPGGLHVEGPEYTVPGFLFDTISSSIGRFSWFGYSDIYLPLWVYTGWEVGLALLAFVTYAAVRRYLRGDHPGLCSMSPMLWVLVLAVLGVFVSYVHFNTQVAYQPQGRYLFPLLLPFTLFLNGGLYMLAPRRFISSLPLIGVLLTLAVSIFVMNAAG